MSSPVLGVRPSESPMWTRCSAMIAEFALFAELVELSWLRFAK